MSIKSGTCPNCDTDLSTGRAIAIEYPGDHPEHYDGVSEWLCPDCGYREGRWTGRELIEDEVEPRYGAVR